MIQVFVAEPAAAFLHKAEIHALLNKSQRSDKGGTYFITPNKFFTCS